MEGKDYTEEVIQEREPSGAFYHFNHDAHPHYEANKGNVVEDDPPLWFFDQVE